MWQEIVDWYNAIEWPNVLDIVIRVIILTVIVFLAYKILLIVIKKALAFNIKWKKKDTNGQKRIETTYSLIRSIMRYFAIPVYIIFLLPIFGVNPSTVFASAGLVGIVISFAFQDLLKDITSGLFIIFEKVYEVDDYIEVNGFFGKVKKIGVKNTVLESWTGEICTMNNRDVGNVKNYTKAEKAICVNYFTVSYDTDIKEVQRVFAKEIKAISKNYPEILVLPEIKGANSLAGNGIEFQVNTVVKPETHWQFRRSFNLELSDMCKRNGFKSPRVMVVTEETEVTKKKTQVRKNGKT